MAEIHTFAELMLDPPDLAERVDPVGTVIVPPNVWTAVLVGADGQGDRIVVQVFHANTGSITLAVFEDGSTEVVGEMPPDGYREQRKPYADSVLGIAERQEREATADRMTALDGHPLNQTPEQKLSRAVMDGYVVVDADGVPHITEAGRVRAAEMMGVDPETIGL